MWTLVNDPRPPLAGAARLLRVCTLSGTSLTLAVSAHVLGGGVAPAPGVLLLAATVLVSVAVLMTQWRCRFWALLVAVGLEQALLHMTFPATSSAGMCLPTVPAAGHAHPGMSPACIPATVQGLDAATPPRVSADMPAAMLLPSWPMLVAHLAATIVVVWVLWRGEALLWRIVARLLGTPSTGPTHAVYRTGWTVVHLRRTRKMFPRPAAPRGPPVRQH